MHSESFKLGMLKIPVRDVQESVAFYEQKLGLNLDFLAPEYGWAQFTLGELSLALYQPNMGGGSRDIGGSVDFHLSLTGNDFDDIAHQLKDEGYLVEDRIHTGADSSTFIDICDPDGNIIKVFRRE
jgi:catechol 2,3-dioxygenase-like lactoylglutathione lyase family enzyme